MPRGTKRKRGRPSKTEGHGFHGNATAAPSHSASGCSSSVSSQSGTSVSSFMSASTAACVPAKLCLTSDPHPASLASTAGTGKKRPSSELTVIEEEDCVPVEHEPLFGQVVWAQLSRYQTFHPAVVIKGSLVNLAVEDASLAFVFWFSDRKVSTVPRETLVDFASFYHQKSRLCQGKQGRQGILKAIEELQGRVQGSGDLHPLVWADSGFPTDHQGPSTLHQTQGDAQLSESILERLRCIGAEIRLKASQKQTVIEDWVCKESAMEAVWKGTKSVLEVCIACADADARVQYSHPLFQGGLCSQCKELLQEVLFAVSEDGTHSFCAVCGSGGQLFVCENIQCGRVFCIQCVEELCREDILRKVQMADQWTCFLCRPFTPESHGLLEPVPDWRQKLVLFYDVGYRIAEIPDLDYFKTRRSLRVLSLFDGIGTGLLALREAGVRVEAYFASEVDVNACTISQANHGTAIQQIGDVTRITGDRLAELVPIDLLIGGSPCNELSLANPRRKGFSIGGSGALFYEYYRVLQKLADLNGSTHLFWLFENVASMCTADRNLISRFFQCQPAVWDAKHLSAQKRTRLFWGNIPGLYSTPEVSDALRKEVSLNSVLTSQCDRRANVQRVRTVTTQPNSLLQGQGRGDKILPVSMAGGHDTLWLPELERLFGFPAHYTDVGNLPVTKRRSLLGKSWSVQVVAQILRPLTEYFASAPGACPPTEGSPTTHGEGIETNQPQELSTTGSPSSEEPGVVGQIYEDSATVDQSLEHSAVIGQIYEDSATVHQSLEHSAVIGQMYEDSATVDQSLEHSAVIGQIYEDSATVDQSLEHSAVIGQIYEDSATVHQSLEHSAVIGQMYKDSATVDQSLEHSAVIGQSYEDSATVDQSLEHSAVSGQI